VDRAEQTGLGVAIVAHAVLFAALSLNLLKPPDLPKYNAEPIDVSLVDTVALDSAAPEPTPAPAGATPEEPAPVEPQVAPPAPTLAPQPKALEKPVSKAPAPAKPTPKAEPAKAKPAQAQRRSGLSRDLVAGLTDAPASTGTPAKTIGPAVASSIGAEIRRQLKPHWKSPTGADVELLRTTLIVRLKRDGSIDGAPTLDSQTGVNDSNRIQAKLHVDQAIRAVRLAAPFQLPAEYYDAWKVIRPTFDKRLSQ